MLELINCVEKAVSDRNARAVRDCVEKWVEGYHQTQN